MACDRQTAPRAIHGDIRYPAPQFSEARGFWWAKIRSQSAQRRTRELPSDEAVTPVRAVDVYPVNDGWMFLVMYGERVAVVGHAATRARAELLASRE